MIQILLELSILEYGLACLRKRVLEVSLVEDGMAHFDPAD
jgi:hypothetical protein